jgi:methyl-accepting chemotaxis protein
MNHFEMLAEQVSEQCYEEAEAYLEGANTEVSRIGKSALRENKALLKEAKRAYRLGETKKAKSLLDKIMKNLDDALDEIDKIDETTGSALIGNIVHSFIMFIKLFLIQLLTFGIGTGIYAIKKMIENVVGTLDQFKRVKDVSPAIANAKRQSLRGMIISLKQVVSKVKKEMGSDGEDVEESTGLQLDIYESCKNGNISEREKEILLDLVQ